jgi:hypothetical protein
VAKSRPSPRPPSEPQATGYFGWSRDPAVGLFAVLPLWLLYEALRLHLAPHERNGAEVLVLDGLHWLGPQAFTVLRVLLLATVLVAMVSLLERSVPWVRVTLVTALEGIVYGLMLGPLAAVMATGTWLARGTDAADFVGSLGAGIFEEAFFRFGILSLLSLGLVRAAAAFGLPRALGVASAVGISALLFALFHHLGPGAQPFTAPVFLFRTMAGLLLGALFVLRGFGVCVYTHAAYDVHYYLTHP